MTSPPDQVEDVTTSDKHSAGRRLRSHGNFLRLWAGQSVSLFGSAVSYIALPLVAVLTLKLGALDIGLLASAGRIPAAILSPFVGTVVDAVDRRRLCITCDIVRAVAVGSVPVAAVTGSLSYVQLVIVSAVMGVCTILFNVSQQTLLPSVVNAEDLAEGNSKLEASQAVSDVAGPGVAAWLMGLSGPAYAVAIDALSYVGSAFFLTRLREGPGVGRRQPPDRVTARRQVRRFLHDTRAGSAELWADDVLRSVSVSYAALAFFAQVQMAVYMLFLVHREHFSPTTIGIVFMIGGVVGFIAALASDRVAGRLGVGPLVVAGQLVMVLGGVLLAAVTGPTVVAAAVMLAGEASFGVGLSFYGVGSRTLNQLRTSDTTRGRVIGSSKVMSSWAVAFAGVVGGAIGELVGTRGTLIVGAAGMVLAVGLVARPAVWRAREAVRTG